MTVYELLVICDSEIIASVYDESSDWIYLRPDSVGGLLASKHWILEKEVVGLTLSKGILIISVEDI